MKLENVFSATSDISVSGNNDTLILKIPDIITLIPNFSGQNTELTILSLPYFLFEGPGLIKSQEVILIQLFSYHCSSQ